MFYPAGGYLGLYFELFGQAPTPTPIGFENFVDTISHRRVGHSFAAVEIEALGQGEKIGIGDSQSIVVVAILPSAGIRRTFGKSYADLRPYRWSTSSLNEDQRPPSQATNASEEELALLEHYMLSLKGED